MERSWSSVPDSEKMYLDSIKTIEQTQYTVVLASLLADILSKNKSQLLNSYLVSV